LVVLNYISKFATIISLILTYISTEYYYVFAFSNLEGDEFTVQVRILRYLLPNSTNWESTFELGKAATAAKVVQIILYGLVCGLVVVDLIIIVFTIK
jgi:hypothetical protein